MATKAGRRPAGRPNSKINYNMPLITKKLNAKIEPRDFLKACNALELKEVDLLIRSKEYQIKMFRSSEDLPTIPEIKKQFNVTANRS